MKEKYINNFENDNIEIKIKNHELKKVKIRRMTDGSLYSGTIYMNIRHGYGISLWHGP
jgi:hypothetical protein